MSLIFLDRGLKGTRRKMFTVFVYYTRTREISLVSLRLIIYPYIVRNSRENFLSTCFFTLVGISLIREISINKSWKMSARDVSLEISYYKALRILPSGKFPLIPITFTIIHYLPTTLSSTTYITIALSALHGKALVS